MRKALIVGAALCAVSPSFAQDATASLGERVDTYFAPLVEMEMFSGTVLIARGGEVVVERAYGLADRERGLANTIDTQFKLMSVSKALTATALMRQVQRGALGLDDPVGDHLPDWPAGWNAVTVHDLLDHTSGIPNLCPTVWSPTRWRTPGKPRGLLLWRRIAAQCADRTLLHQPGSQARYSNFNLELAGAVLEAASGKPFRTCMDELLLRPVGMQRTGFDDGSRRDGLSIGYSRRDGEPSVSQQDMATIQAAGGFYSTVRDLYRLDRALHGEQLVDAATRQRMFTPKHGYFGCGWRIAPVHGHRCVQHSGGANGYVADFLRFVDDDACVVVMSNFAFAPIGRFSNDLAGLLFERAVAQPVALRPEALPAYEGTFPVVPGQRTILVRRSGRVLMAYDVWHRNDRQGSRMLIPLGDDTFATAFGTTRLRIRGGSLELLDAGKTQSRHRDAAVAAWQHQVGAYECPDALGENARLQQTDGSLRLRFGLRVGERSLTVLPVSTSEAIVLYSETGGTMMRRDGDTLRWVDAAGRRFELARK